MSPELSRWLAEGSFLVGETGNLNDELDMRSEIRNMCTILSRPDIVSATLHRALARAEARAPTSARGTFIAAGQPFDALAAVSKILVGASLGVLIVDAYAESNLLDTFLRSVLQGVPIRVLVDAQALKPSLQPSAEAWGRQFGQSRPLEVRVAPKSSLHDRLLLIDAKEVWLLGQSFNHLATRSNTYLQKADPEFAQMKLDAYEAIWLASPLL